MLISDQVLHVKFIVAGWCERAGGRGRRKGGGGRRKGGRRRRGEGQWVPTELRCVTG